MEQASAQHRSQLSNRRLRTEAGQAGFQMPGREEVQAIALAAIRPQICSNRSLFDMNTMAFHSTPLVPYPASFATLAVSAPSTTNCVPEIYPAASEDAKNAIAFPTSEPVLWLVCSV